MIADLSGRAVLVAGGGSPGGIGGAIVEVLVAQGAHVAVGDIDSAGVEQVLGGVPTDRAFGVHLDVSEATSVVQAVRTAEAKLGSLDGLVISAGVLGGSGRDAWEETFRVNVMGTVNCVEAVLPDMRRRRGGSIVSIASAAGHSSRRTAGAYASSKAATLRYVKGMALRVASDGVTMNAICPGAVWAQMQMEMFRAPADVDPAYEGLSPRDAFELHYRHVIPQNRTQEPMDIAKTAAFLVSSDARSITGQCIHVDGGAVCE